MRFRILGPVHMTPRTPSAAKPRAVLATLLVQSGTVVSVHTLIDELWCSEPPRTAATTLQVYVSQLRKALLQGEGEEPREQALLTRPPGYLMRVGPDELDLNVFESLRAQGREAYEQRNYAESSALLGQALGLWTGAALSGVPHGPMLETSAVRLDELRTEVLEQRISADLRLGRHHELVGELMALAHSHPMRETLHAHLMVALYRSGRQSDALAAYRRARRALVDELGVEPGPALNRLQERVLAADPALAWHEEPSRAARPAPAAPAEPGPVLWLPPDVANFTGRQEQLALGARLLDGDSAVPTGVTDTSAQGGPDKSPMPTRVLAVSGRAGSGKTTLAVHLAHGAADGFPDGRILLNLRDAGGQGVDPVRTMATLLRRLGAADSPGAESVPGDIEELSDLLHRSTRGRKLLIVMDDAVSEAQVRPVLSAVPDSTVVITSRQALGALEGVQHLVLDVLNPQDAEDLLVAAGGTRMAEEPAAVTEMAKLCGYLPLALRVAAAGLAARPHWKASELAGRLRNERTRLAALALGDLDVRSSLLTAYRDVGPEEQHAFRLLALAPVPDFAPWSAAALLDTSPTEAEQLAEELVRANLLEAHRSPASRTPVRYGFHSLLRSLALEMLAEEAAPAVVPEATERLGRACLALARHADARLCPGRDRLAQTGAGGAGAELGDGWTDAEARALIGGSPLWWFREEAAGLLEAVRKTHKAGLWQLTSALASAVSGYYEACGLWDEWETGHELALDAARQSGDAHAEAVVLRSLGDLAWQRHHAARALDRYHLAQHFFSRSEDAVGAARCLTGEADVLLGQGHADRAAQCYEQALNLGRAEGDARGVMEALRGLAFVELVHGRARSALARLGECEAAAELAGDTRWREYARRSAEAARAVSEGEDGAAHGPMPLEVRPGVWLVQPPSAVPSAV